jgi:hypothetical protein
MERQGLIQKECGLARDMADRQLRFFEQRHKGGLMKDI